jgi:hypothetical protein
MAIAYNTSVVRNGLVLYLDAANPKSYPGSGTTVFDMKNGINGTLINGVSFNSTNKGHFSFDGLDDYINLGDNALLNNTLNGSTNWTICYWCNPLTDGRILDRGNLAQDPTGSLELNAGSIFRNNASGSSSILSTNIINTGWNYVCLTRNSSLLISWYLNGIFSNSTQATESFGGSGIWKIGRRAANLSSIYSGDLSIISIYNKVLTIDEVKENFEATRGRFGI